MKNGESAPDTWVGYRTVIHFPGMCADISKWFFRVCRGSSYLGTASEWCEAWVKDVPGLVVNREVREKTLWPTLKLVPFRWEHTWKLRIWKQILLKISTCPDSPWELGDSQTPVWRKAQMSTWTRRCFPAARPQRNHEAGKWGLETEECLKNKGTEWVKQVLNTIVPEPRAAGGGTENGSSRDGSGGVF